MVWIASQLKTQLALLAHNTIACDNLFRAREPVLTYTRSVLTTGYAWLRNTWW